MHHILFAAFHSMYMTIGKEGTGALDNHLLSFSVKNQYINYNFKLLLIRRMEEEMRFSVQIVEKELVEERKKNNIDLSALDSKLKMEYESRFAKILTKGNDKNVMHNF